MLLPTNKTIVILKLLAFLVVYVTAPKTPEIIEIVDDEIPEVVEGHDTALDPRQAKIEEKYYNEMHRGQNINKYTKICQFTANKKAVLCQKCFDRLNRLHEEYKDTYDNIFITPEVFKAKQPKCYVNNLKMSHPLFAKITQLVPVMYPCYGRHVPIHTDIHKDEYNDFIHIGGGPNPDSVALYKHEKSLTDDWYTLIEIFDNMDIQNIEDNLEPVDIEATRKLSFNNRGPLVENVYLLEMSRVLRNANDRDISNLSFDQLDKLCTTIFSHERTSSIEFNINEKAYESKQTILVEYNRVVFLFLKGSNESRIQQPMVACYGTDNNGRPLDNLVKISSGPRPNSVVAYIRDEIAGFTGYRPYLIVENIVF